MASIAKAVSCLVAMTVLLALLHVESVSARRGHPKSNFILMPGRRSPFDDLLQQENTRRDNILESATPDLLSEEDDSTKIDLELLREIEKWLKAQTSSKTYKKPFMQDAGENGEY
ncbi:uncharacterized protein [Antedon mediterranea]|uniref:uncharacterized protein n=1 Tax=Antedon mediterranea TaxID=105859 RepID=UPI003AF76FFC